MRSLIPWRWRTQKVIIIIDNLIQRWILITFVDTLINSYGHLHIHIFFNSTSVLYHLFHFPFLFFCWCVFFLAKTINIYIYIYISVKCTFLWRKLWAEIDKLTTVIIHTITISSLLLCLHAVLLNVLFMYIYNNLLLTNRDPCQYTRF